MSVNGSVAAWSRRSRASENGVADERVIPNLREFDQPRPVRESASKLRRDPDRKAGLPDTPRPDEADETRGGELRP